MSQILFPCNKCLFFLLHCSGKEAFSQQNKVGQKQDQGDEDCARDVSEETEFAESGSCLILCLVSKDF